MILEVGPDKNARDKFGLTPLHLAVLWQNHEAISRLMDHKSDLDVQDFTGRSALHWAVERHSQEIVKMLLTSGAKIEIKDNMGLTPLHYAAENENGVCTLELLKAGAEVNAKDNVGMTPLTIALQNNTEDCKEILLSYGARVADSFVTTFLRTELNALLNKEFDPLFKCNPLEGRNDISSFFRATVDGDCKKVTELIQRGADINQIESSRGMSPLHVAARMEKIEIMKILCQYLEDMDQRDFYEMTPLHYAAMGYGSEAAFLLIGNGATVECKR